MPKYLVVRGTNSGIAELLNVLIIEAQSVNDAREQARVLEHSVDITCFWAGRLDELEANWRYYQ